MQCGPPAPPVSITLALTCSTSLAGGNGPGYILTGTACTATAAAASAAALPPLSHRHYRQFQLTGVPPGAEPLTLVTGAAGGSSPGGVLAEEATSLGVVAVVVEPTTLLKLSNNYRDRRSKGGLYWSRSVVVTLE
jgi:hypothetical protein